MADKTNKPVHAGKFIRFIGSNTFFKLIVAALVAQASWIALSARYPMAFDEDYHLGIIRLYSHHLTPFWRDYFAGPAPFGPVSRDPSYLYHYLMSFPYRLIDFFTNNQAAQVLFLRAINIALFVAGLILFRSLLLKSRASRTKINAVLAAFVLLPVVPFLAAQINYDNLFLPLTTAALILTARIGIELRQHQRLRPRLLAALVILCLLTSLVKYAFLPIMLAIGIYLAVCLYRAYPTTKAAYCSFKIGWSSIKTSTRLLLVAGLIISGWLFLERYGINSVRYHSLAPSCHKVLTVESCQAYGPWNRDYNLSRNKAPDTSGNVLYFSARWFYGMWFRSFFAVAGPDNHYQTLGPLTMPGIAAIFLTVVAVIAAILAGRRVLFSHDGTAITLFLLASALYLAVLWLQQYGAFLRTGQAVAINGRYLLPVLPMLMLICVLGLNKLLSRRAAALLMGAGFLCLLWGGGALTFILRSSDAWYWPNGTVKTANHGLKNVLGPLTPGYNRPRQFMSWN